MTIVRIQKYLFALHYQVDDVIRVILNNEVVRET